MRVSLAREELREARILQGDEVGRSHGIHSHFVFQE